MGRRGRVIDRKFTHTHTHTHTDADRMKRFREL